MHLHTKRRKWIIILAGLIVLLVIYKNINPDGNRCFPKCPFKTFTGWQCPGCGAQRAIHHLLNFDLYHALKENALLVIAMPYFMIGFIFDNIEKPNRSVLWWRKSLFGKTAIFIVLIIVISFWIMRNYSMGG